MFNQPEMALVPFDGHQIQVTKDDNHLVVLKPVVQNIGLDWPAIHTLITRDEVLKSVVCKLQTTGADGKNYKMLAVPLKMLTILLCKINASEYKHKPELKAKIVKYQFECADVLYRYFTEGVAVNEKAAEQDQTVAVNIIAQFAEQITRLNQSWMDKLFQYSEALLNANNARMTSREASAMQTASTLSKKLAKAQEKVKELEMELHSYNPIQPMIIPAMGDYNEVQKKTL